MASIDSGGSHGGRSLNHELPLVPFIDFLLCLVAFLLVTAVWAHAARISADAKVPGGSGTDPGVSNKELHVAVAESDFELTWKQGNTVLDRRRVPRHAVQLRDGTNRYSELGAALSSEWKTHGAHQSASDAALDRAVLHTGNALDFAEIVAVLDAIHSTKRVHQRGGGAELVPAFAVSFAVD